MNTDEKERSRIIRKTAAALLSSNMSVREVEALARMIKSDDSVMATVVASCLAALEQSNGVVDVKEKSVAVDSSRRSQLDSEKQRLVNFALKRVDSGEISRDALVGMIYQMGLMEMSLSTMKKMQIKVLLERLISKFSLSDARNFMVLLSSLSEGDSYLRVIEKDRGKA